MDASTEISEEDRTRDIVASRLAGTTLAALGARYQMTRQGVHAAFKRGATDEDKKKLAERTELARMNRKPVKKGKTVRIKMARLHVLVPGAANMDPRAVVDELASWATGGQKPPKTERGGERLDIYLPAELKQRVIERCASHGVKVSDAVRYVASKLETAK